MVTISDKILADMIELAQEEIWSDEHNYSPSEENCFLGDVFESGIVNGEVLYVRNLLDDLGVEWRKS